MPVQDTASSNAAERRQLLLFCTSALVLSVQLQAPATLPPVPTESELGGPESQCGRFRTEKSFLLLRGIESLTVHLVGAFHMGSMCNIGLLVVRLMNRGSKVLVWSAVCDTVAQHVIQWHMCDEVARHMIGTTYVVQWHNM